VVIGPALWHYRIEQTTQYHLPEADNVLHPGKNMKMHFLPCSPICRMKEVELDKAK
jgi:hypothetical protein